MEALANMWGIPHHIVDRNTNFRSFGREYASLKR